MAGQSSVAHLTVFSAWGSRDSRRHVVHANIKETRLQHDAPGSRAPLASQSLACATQ